MGASSRSLLLGDLTLVVKRFPKYSAIGGSEPVRVRCSGHGPPLSGRSLREKHSAAVGVGVENGAVAQLAEDGAEDGAVAVRTVAAYSCCIGRSILRR